MKIVCTYVSDSGKSALFNVEKELGAVNSVIASGFLGINEEIEKGYEQEIPDDTEVSTRESHTEDGEVFPWLILR